MAKNTKKEIKVNIDESRIHIAFPGIDDKYIDRAFERIKMEGIPDKTDMLTWLGKLIVLEIVADTLK